uniref:Uncharacterized protein n=1 Tax=Helianthus annuus TaxID=4232 RepID=A0A251RZR6_HELAN
MCLLVTFVPFMLSYHMLVMFNSTLIVHDFIVFMLCMPIVCILIHHFTLHFMLCMPIVCILSTFIHHMLTFWYDIWFV